MAYGFSQVDNVFMMASYFAATVYLHCPYTWLWTPAMKRPAVATQEASHDLPASSHRKKRRDSTPISKEEDVLDDATAAAAATATSPPEQQRRRYNSEFWGRAWTTEPGKKDSKMQRKTLPKVRRQGHNFACSCPSRHLFPHASSIPSLST